MIILNFNELREEIICILERERSTVLATSAKDKVTARMMSHINDGLKIYFQTSRDSEKAKQIEQNPYIALATANLQIEGIAEFCGHPKSSKNADFIGEYIKKFPGYFEKYSSLPEEVVVRVTITKAVLYKYIDGKPCRDVLDVENDMTYRELI